MAVGTLHDDLLAVDEEAILLATIDMNTGFLPLCFSLKITMPVLNGAEAKALTLHM